MTKNIRYFAFWGLLCSPALADDAATRSDPLRVIVIAAEAPLMVGREVRGNATSGTLLRVTQSQEDWLFVPAREAWIKSDRVVSLDSAEQHFTQIINREPTAAAYHHRGIARHALGFPKQALKDFDQALELRMDSAALFINRANACYDLGKTSSALRDLNSALEREPKSALAYNNRALVHAALGDLDRAMQDASTAIEIDPSYADAFNNRGVTRAKLGDYKAAIEDYGEAIRLNDRMAEAYANRADAAGKLGQYEQALSDYRQAVALDAASPQAFNDAAWLCATCPDSEIRDPQQAIEYALHACELTGYKRGDFVDTLAAAYAADGQFDQAVRTQQQALALLPEQSQAAARERLGLYRTQQPFIEQP